MNGQPVITDPAINPEHDLDAPPGSQLVDDEYEHPERPDAIPTTEPPMPWTFYGVPLSTCGEEGDLLALGHVEPRRFIAAAGAVAREIHLGADEILGMHDTPYDERPAEVEANLVHGWALFLAPLLDPGDWWAWQVDKDREGAIPVTWWTL